VAGGPLLSLTLVVDRRGMAAPRPVVVDAVVDSGSDYTTLPFSLAWDLGIEANELTLHAAAGRSVDSRFELWTSSATIRAQVSERDPASGVDSPWGPTFGLDPSFVDDDMFLLGRADFFSVFTVTFEEGRGRVFHLDV
jgi:hypothetical protein